MLSTVCSVYDPLGIVAPVILVGRQILQDLCHNNYGWDEPVLDKILYPWEKWGSELHLLEQVKQPRCLKPIRFGKPVTVEIHSFSDASDVGIGQVSYLCLINSEGKINVSFLMKKGFEVKTEVAATLTIKQVNVLKVFEANRFKHPSSFDRLKRSLILIQRMIERKRRNKQHNWRPQEGPSKSLKMPRG